MYGGDLGVWIGHRVAWPWRVGEDAAEGCGSGLTFGGCNVHQGEPG